MSDFLEMTQKEHPFTDGHHLLVYNKKLDYMHPLCGSQLLMTYDLGVKRPGRDDLHLFYWGAGYTAWRNTGMATTLHNGIELCAHCSICHSLIVANQLRIGRPQGLRLLKKLEKAE